VSAETPLGRATGTSPARGSTTRSRSVLLTLAVVLTVGAMGQFFLAGLSVFDTPVYWADHATFGSALGMVAYVVWIPAVLGRVGRRLVGGAVLLPVLFTLQHVFPASAEPYVQALHPLNGAVLFALSLWIACRSVGLLRQPAAPPTSPSERRSAP